MVLYWSEKTINKHRMNKYRGMALPKTKQKKNKKIIQFLDFVQSLFNFCIFTQWTRENTQTE